MQAAKKTLKRPFEIGVKPLKKKISAHHAKLELIAKFNIFIDKRATLLQTCAISQK